LCGILAHRDLTDLTPTMQPDFLTSPFLIAAVIFGTLGVVLMLTGVLALFRLRPFRFVFRTLLGMLLLSLGTLSAVIGLGIQGYRALTREDVAAHIQVRPAGPQRFEATFRFADGREAKFDLAGDEIYVDAHILKWNPRANALGLHTAYELDRVAGRFHAVEQEHSAQRTVYPLSQYKPVDLFALRRRYTLLSPVLDAEYGSATFVPVTAPADFELRVSTTGLLIREIPAAQK
jgi:hypothetical protein